MSGESFLATLEPGEWSIDAGRPEGENTMEISQDNFVNWS
jgi:hypothetical protein